MAIDLTDIYECNNLIDEIKRKYIDINDEALQMGIFGYLGEIHSNILQNSAQTLAENSLEGLPTKAKFPRSILNHAYSLGLTSEAVPAYMDVLIFLPEERIQSNLNYNNSITIPQSFPIYIDFYEFHLDYDLIITKRVLPNDEVVYTGLYDMNTPNPLSDVSNPYVQQAGRFIVSNTSVLAMQVRIRQYSIDTEEVIILDKNPLLNKTFNFTFKDQMSKFRITVKEGDVTTELEPVYDSQLIKSESKYINYTFLESDTIRCLFRKDSYQPNGKASVIVTKYMTKGAAANFKYTETIICTLTSYKDLWMIVKPLTDSMGGEDAKSIQELKTSIPIELLSRGTITNSKDLYSFFNSINDEDHHIYFLKKLDSFDRLYYSYIALKDSYNNVIPTNTISLNIERNQFDKIDNNYYQLYPMNIIHYKRNSDGVIITSYISDEDSMSSYNSNGFLYTNIFTILLNKNPFYVSYILTLLNNNILTDFTYINRNCPIQFITESVNWKRQYFIDKDTYILTATLLSNSYNDTTNNDYFSTNVKAILVLKNSEGRPSRYIYGTVTSYSSETNSAIVQFRITTDNTFDKSMELKLTNLYDISQSYIAPGYFPQETQADIYYLTKLPIDYGGREEISSLVPNLRGWSCTNKYSIISGLPLYYNYTKEISTVVNITQSIDNSLHFNINKVPVVKYEYLLSDERILEVIDQLQTVKSYIEYKLETIEDGFGLDIKLFNTYGPAKFFMLNDGRYLDNVSLSLRTKTKLLPGDNEQYLTDIINYIKSYIEDFTVEAPSLHMPNLQADVTKRFSELVEYFEFIGLNDYQSNIQHIYREDFESKISEVPELLNIKVKSDDTPDITIEISSN